MSPHPRIQSKFLNVVFGGQDANVIISQPCGVYFVQSEMDFAAVASETVKFTEMYFMEAKKEGCPGVREHGGIPIVFISINWGVTQFVNVSFLCVPVHEDTTEKGLK